MDIHCWQMTAPSQPLQHAVRTLDDAALTGDQALVSVAGCGVCHTDLGFLYDGVRTRHALPLTLGRSLVGSAVVVPAVIPCGECPACRAGRGAICPRQFFPGNDDHGGFASHVVVPARGLCPVDEQALAASGIDLATLSVIADAVTTPYQAILNAGLSAGQLAIFIGIGWVGGFGVQIARHMGAHVVAIDVDPVRLEQAGAAGDQGRDPCLRSAARAAGDGLADL